MTILINLMLVFAISLLVWPRPLKKTLRLFVPAAVSLVSVVIAAVIISWGAFRTVTVTALNDKNAAAEGTEIWIKSVMINGIEHAPEDVFSDGWLCEDGYLKWRNYDQPKGMTDSLTAVFPAGSQVGITFQTNVWRGKAEILDGSGVYMVYTVDCYANTKDRQSDGSSTELKVFSGIGIDRETRVKLAKVGLAVLLISSIIWFSLLYLDFIGKRQEIVLWLKRGLKIAVPITAAMALGFGVFLAINKSGEQIITITALNSKNPSAEGTEIWLKSVVVDGVEHLPEEVFSSGWLTENGWLKWRNYDTPEGISSSITATLPAGSDVDIVFQTNKWRGLAEVKRGSFVSLVYRIDCWSATDRQDVMVNSSESSVFSGIRVTGTVMFIAFLGVLIVLAGVCSIMGKSRERPAGKPREVWLDALKVMCAPLVVMIHTIGGPYSSVPVNSSTWLGYLIINALSRCAVPLFIMISGILLIGRETTKEKVLRDVKRALILLVVWNVFYILVHAALYGPSESVIKQIISLPVKRGPSGHLWYGHFLVWVYAFSPVVSILYKALTNKMRFYFVVITVLIPGLLDLYLKFFDLNGSSTLYAFQIYITLNYIGVMFLGRMIYEYAVNTRKAVLYSVFTLCVGFSGVIGVTYVYARLNGNATDKFLSETQLLPVLFGAGVLSLFACFRKRFADLPTAVQRTITRLSGYSIGIYFIHSFNIWIIKHISIGSVDIAVGNSVFQAVIMCAFYYILSVVEVALIARIPPLKKLVT